MNKGDLPLMYSCVFWCEFIAVYSVFWLLLFHPCHSVHNTKWRQHRKTAGGPDLVYLKAVCGLKTHRIADFFDQRQTSIIAAPQLTFKSEISPCMLLEMNISSSHVQCRDTAPDTGRWLRGQISLDRGWLSQQRKPRNKRFLLLFRFYRFWSFLFIVVIVISILLKTAFWQTSFHSQWLVKSL